MSLITKYRPKTWEDLIGNDKLVVSIQDSLLSGNSQAYLLHGESGCGKTTIARLGAKTLEIPDENIIELDAAAHNGIDDMRELINEINYKPLFGRGKAIIIDECQAITTQAWKTLLKSIEEPPIFIYWFLCTTEPNKVPANIRNRCSIYQVSTLTVNQLKTLLSYISVKEGIRLPNKKIIELCAIEAEGSPRRAIANYAQVINCQNYEEAIGTIGKLETKTEPMIELARQLLKNSGWGAIQNTLTQLKNENPESIRRVIEAYITKVMINENESVIQQYIMLLELFSQPINYNNISPIVLASAKWTFKK